MALDDIKNAGKRLLNAQDKQFKVNKTSESVAVTEEWVNEKKPIKKHACCGAILEKDWRNHKCKIEEESIWKPVSELPYNYAKVILKIKAGTHYYLEAFFKDDEFYDEELEKSFDNLLIRKECIKEWCYRTDPLKDYEKLKERVKKLEGSN